MIALLKKTVLGKRLYRLSRSPLGRPLAVLATLMQHERFQLSHLKPAHRRHNQEQLDILAKFDARSGRAQ